MNMEKQRISGLIGKCLLVGTLAIAGCQPFSYPQEQRLFGLTRMAQMELQSRRRDQAIKEAGTQRNVDAKNDNVEKVTFIMLENYGDGWRESGLPLLKFNTETKHYAPKPGYIWEDSSDVCNLRVIPTERNLKEIEDYKIIPKNPPGKSLDMSYIKAN